VHCGTRFDLLVLLEALRRSFHNKMVQQSQSPERLDLQKRVQNSVEGLNAMDIYIDIYQTREMRFDER
jgi:hypothetical protein